MIEACAGSGKTWMLVSRIVRLLLAGASPSQILAITFTRKAAQEMATRLRDWLFELATAPDEAVRRFLRDRAVAEGEIEALLPKARHLYERFLTAQPPITIATFHSWFLQLLRRAPLDAGALGDVNLLEQTSSLVDEAWQSFATVRSAIARVRCARARPAVPRLRPRQHAPVAHQLSPSPRRLVGLHARAEGRGRLRARSDSGGRRSRPMPT